MLIGPQYNIVFVKDHYIQNALPCLYGRYEFFEMYIYMYNSNNADETALKLQKSVPLCFLHARWMVRRS